MPNTNAYTVNVAPNTLDSNENRSVNQSSPSWVLTFVRWENRDTLRNKSVKFSELRSDDPLVIQNDCVSVTVATNKGSLTPSMNATFVETDVNYMTAIAPGDFVFVNMLNWEDDAVSVAEKANARQPINSQDDGFKGLFKVQSVRKTITTDPESGTITVLYKIDGYGFTEFNNTIYFNPNLLAGGDKDNFSLFARNLSVDWASLVNAKTGFFNVQDLVALLIQSFIGTGIDTEYLRDDFKSLLPTANTHFYIPKMVGALLGIPNAQAAKDIYSYLFGVQNYAPQAASMAEGLNPFVKTKSAVTGFRYAKIKCKGDTPLKPEFWNGAKAWSIIQQYLNSPLNEMYTCYRIGSKGSILPTVVMRQIPFTSQDFADRTGISASVTKFMNLPRWKVDPALVYSLDVGRDEAARINFMQYYSRVGVEAGGAGPAAETAAKNYEFDVNDVKRSGLRPSIVSNYFDPIATGANDTGTAIRSPIWAKIVADALMGGHLKLNGTMECLGIQAPITIGDNLEFDGTVYHIESVVHMATLDTSRGVKTFRTVVKLSSGISLESVNATVYAEMENTNAYNDRKSSTILPGISESQNTLKRGDKLDSISSKNKPFPQPE